MNSREAEELLRGALVVDGNTGAALAETLKEVPLDPSLVGQYLCGCPWSGAIIPHFCPTHYQGPVFVIRGEPLK
jgi:hypothetical protein